MKRFPLINLMVMLSLLFFGTGLISPSTASASSPQTYTVLVGAENISRRTSIMANFPETLHVHVGDTVVWDQNTHEPHTVTFLAGGPLPPLVVPTPPGFQPAGLMFNPQIAWPVVPGGGLYDGSTFAGSGFMTTDPGYDTEFRLTFTQAGTFEYLCAIHGMMMPGTIVVEPGSISIPSPAEVSKQVDKDITQRLAQANNMFDDAMAQVPAPTQNPDGSTHYTVLIGWSEGQALLMDFLPEKLVVHPGDTVTFELSATNLGPHTVTFLNGAADLEAIVQIPYPPNPDILYVNPQVLFPINPGQPLTREGIYNSGFLDPTPPFPTSYTLQIGNISGEMEYDCVLHDSSGMEAELKVVP